MNVLEMIKIFNAGQKTEISDLIDISFLQELQDNFADMMNIACVTVDKNGPITKPSNFTDFYTKNLGSNEPGLQQFNKCSIENNQSSLKKGEPIIYTCLAELTHFIIPIVVNGKQIASVLGGQVSTTKLNEAWFTEIAEKLGISYDHEYITELKKNKIFSEKDIKMTIKLLSLIVNAVSKIAQANYILIEKNKREKLTEKIVEKIRSTLKTEDIKKYFIEIVREYFDADRCLFLDYDAENNKFLPFKSESLKSVDIKSLIGFSAEDVFPEFCAKLKKGKDIIIKDLEKILLRKQLLSYKAVKTLKEKDTKSDYGILIKFREKIIGVLIIHFIERKKVFSHDEFDFLGIIRKHVGTALFQSELYHITKQQSDKEVLLRHITETIRKSLNFDKTKKIISEVIGKTLKADRCFILEYNKTEDKILIVNEEYLSSDSILSYEGVDLNEHIPSIAEELKKGKRLIINGDDLTIDGERVDFTVHHFEDARNAVEEYKIHSALVFPLFYSDEFLGDLVLHYLEAPHKIGNDEIKFLNLISGQIAIALYQSKLHEKVQMQAERERISRNIIEILRSTLDKSMIEHLFVRNIGKYFGADRVFFSEFEHKTNKYLPISEQSEYLSSTEEKSYVNHDFLTTEMKEHIHPLLDKREILIPNWKMYIEKSYKTHELIEFYKSAKVKSSYSFPVLYEGKIMGFFGVEFTKKITELMEEDINRLRNICTQAGIALYHAELYMEAQKALQSKGEIIAKVKEGIEKPVDEIIKTSKILTELELERDKQKEYLNSIINSCNRLLELTKDISDI